MPSDRHILPHNHHVDHPAHPPFAECNPGDRMEVTVWLAPHTGSFPSLDDPADLVHPDRQKVLDFAARHHLAILGYHGKAGMILSGYVLDMEQAFGVDLLELHHPDGGTYRGHTDPVSVPAELGSVITGVFGLDERPVAKPHFRKWKPRHEHHEGVTEKGTR